MPRRSGAEEQVTTSTRRRSEINLGVNTSFSRGLATEKDSHTGYARQNFVRKKAKVTFFDSARFEICNLQIVEDEFVKEILSPLSRSPSPVPAVEMSPPPKGEPSKVKQSKKGKGKKARIVTQDLTLEERRLVQFRNGVPFQYGKDEHLPMDYSSIREMNKRKLNDILDLNEGEKEMMNMWNEFIHDIHGRCLLHVNAIVNSFIEQRAHVIFQRNLYRNFVVLLSSMADSSLIDTESCYQFILKTQGLLASNSARSQLSSPAAPASPCDNEISPRDGAESFSSVRVTNQHQQHPRPADVPSSASCLLSTPTGGCASSPGGGPSSRSRSGRSSRSRPNSVATAEASPGQQSPFSQSGAAVGQDRGAKRGLWAPNQDKSVDRLEREAPKAKPDGTADLNHSSRLAPRVTSNLTSNICDRQRSRLNVIDKIRRVSSILDDKDEVGGLEPLVLELSESDGEDSQLQTFIKAFNKDEQKGEEKYYDIESEIPLLTIYPKAARQTSQVRGGSEDLNRLDSDFLVLCNIENQPPASRPRKKKENKKEKEHRGSPFCEVVDLLSDHEDPAPVLLPHLQPVLPAQIKKRSRSESKPLVRILEGNSAKKVKRSNSSSALHAAPDKLLPQQDTSQICPNQSNTTPNHSTTNHSSTNGVWSNNTTTSCLHFRSSPDLEVSFPGLNQSNSS